MVDGPLHEVTFCPKCHAENHAKATTCSSCGHRLQPAKKSMHQIELDRRNTKQMRSNSFVGSDRDAGDGRVSPAVTTWTIILFISPIIAMAAMSSKADGARQLVAWACIGLASLSASWLLIRSAILSALRQWNHERQ